MSPVLPYAHGGPPLTARLRVTPEDFMVDELLGHGADGAGEHVLLTVEKRAANTDWVARELARFAGVRAMAVGYAGLKDRHAVTRQAFSVQLAGQPEPDWSQLALDGVRVLASARHGRKLRRGALQGNRFRLLLRDVAGDRQRAGEVLQAIRSHGVPNYFGEQRFGRAGGNIEQARALFAGRRVSRHTRSLLISAARSKLFNDVLARRVQDRTWSRPLAGEVWCLAGSRSWFGPETLTPELERRLADGDIHPSGPLWGQGDPSTRAEAKAVELAAIEADRSLATGLEQQGLGQDRRPLRLLPGHLAWHWPRPEQLQLDFVLPAGSYATVVVRELALAAGECSGRGPEHEPIS